MDTVPLDPAPDPINRDSKTLVPSEISIRPDVEGISPITMYWASSNPWVIVTVGVSVLRDAR